MIETFKDLKHGTHGRNSYESLKLERTASQLIHRMQESASEDSLESTKARVLGRSSMSLMVRFKLIVYFEPTLGRSTVLRAALMWLLTEAHLLERSLLLSSNTTQLVAHTSTVVQPRKTHDLLLWNIF